MNEPRENTIKTSAGETHAEDPRADDEQPIKEKADEPGDNPDNRQTLTAEENERFHQALSDAVTVSRTITDSIDRIRQPGINIINQTRAIAEAARCPAIEAMQAIQTAHEAIRSPLAETMSAVYEATRGAQEILQRINSMTPNLTSMQNYFRSDEWRNIKESLQEIVTIAPAWLELAEEMEELSPYLEAELKKPEYDGKVIDELLEEAETDENGDPLETSLFIQALNAARAARDAETEPNQLPAIHYNNSNEFRTVTDKLANLFFSPNAPIGGNYINGQRTMIPLKYEGKKSKKEITLFYDYVFNEDIIMATGLQKKFDDYDFFVMSTLDNLKYEGNEIVSLTKIWHEMGNTGTPGTKHLTELTNSLRKGLSTTITVDDKQVKEAWGYDVSKYHELISPAMPVQILTEKFTANGYIAAGTVKIYSFSPFFLVAQPLSHYGAWNKNILSLYTGRRTKRYYAVMRYLIKEIGWMLNDKSKRNNKLALQSLYNYAGDKTARAKQLTKKMTYRLLDEVFIPTGYIKYYKEDAQDGGICLFWEKQKTISNKRKNLPSQGKK